MFELEYCIVYDWEHSEGIDENNSVVFGTKEATERELAALEKMGNATNIRVYHMYRMGVGIYDLERIN